MKIRIIINEMLARVIATRAYYMYEITGDAPLSIDNDGVAGVNVDEIKLMPAGGGKLAPDRPAAFYISVFDFAR